MPTTTPQEVETQVQELVANNKPVKAISLLIDHFKEVGDKPRHQATLKLSAQVKTIEKQLSMSEITQEAANVGMSKIIDAILNIFKSIPIIGDEFQTQEPDRFGQRIIQVSAMLIILLLIIGIIVSVVTQGVDPVIKAIQASLFVVGAAMVAFGLLFMVKKFLIA